MFYWLRSAYTGTKISNWSEDCKERGWNCCYKFLSQGFKSAQSPGGGNSTLTVLKKRKKIILSFFMIIYVDTPFMNKLTTIRLGANHISKGRLDWFPFNMKPCEMMWNIVESCETSNETLVLAESVFADIFLC